MRILEHLDGVQILPIALGDRLNLVVVQRANVEEVPVGRADHVDKVVRDVLGGVQIAS